jgi:hypothetical protein
MKVLDQNRCAKGNTAEASLTPVERLAALVTQQRFTEADIESRFRLIQELLLGQSRHVRQANFTAIHTHDLEFLLKAYDETVFGGLLRQAAGTGVIRFRLSSRMTSAGGRTTRFRTRDGETSFEIAIACGLLFQGFGNSDRETNVCGLRCENRLQAMLHIFEHELVHLTEYLCWADSNCAHPRFQDIASRHFLHRAHTHELITWKERAWNSGIRMGSIVGFVFDGARLQGRVNRITKRVTVLVEDTSGVLYSDGRRYRKYYVPLRALKAVDSVSTSLSAESTSLP